MRHVVTLALLAFGLLAINIACDDNSDDAPAATDTPVVEATATEAVPATTTPRPNVEGPCPIDNANFCDFAEDFDQALRDGDIETILANTLFASVTCSGTEIEGPCGELPDGGELSGYIISFDHSDYSRFETEETYLAMLSEIAVAADASVSDEYGDGTWRLAAIIDDPDKKVLVTTSIGPDPLYEFPELERRVFLFWARRTDGVWLSSLMLTTLVDEQWLAGTYNGGSPRPGWLPWGEE